MTVLETSLVVFELEEEAVEVLLSESGLVSGELFCEGLDGGGTVVEQFVELGQFSRPQHQTLFL